MKASNEGETPASAHQGGRRQRAESLTSVVDRPLEGTGAEAVGLVGSVTAVTADRWRQVLLERVWDAELVVVDLSEVTFMDSSGLSVLVTLHRHLEGHGRRLVVAGPTEVCRLLTVTGLEQVIAVHPTVEAAVGAQRGDG